MEEGKNTFWGLIVRANKRYEQNVDEAFHVSMACLEPSTAGDGPTTLYCDPNGDGEEFILANLSSKALNVKLDLEFGKDEKIVIKAEGPGTVHLTGYLSPDEDDMMLDGEPMPDYMDDSDEESEDEAVPALVNGNKRKAEIAAGESKAKKSKQTPLDKLLEKKKESEKKAAAVKQAESAKKKLLAKMEEEEDDEDSDEYEDMDEDDGEDGEEDDDDDDEEEEEEEPKPKKKDEKTPKKDEKTPKKGDKKTAESPKTPSSDGDKKTPAKTPKRTIKGGITVEELSAGNGPEAKRGKAVGMYYEGKLATNGKKFDSCLKGAPFKFTLGAGKVIKGWDLGLEGMKVGGKRRLTIPPKMAYGSQGAPPDIPPNSTLVFDVECKFVK